MAKCKLCKTNIPDGTEYCENCHEKGNVGANESYLDSLLNSVKNQSPSIENMYKKNNSLKNSPEKDPISVKGSDTQDFDIYTLDPSDIEDFDQFNIGEDLTSSDLKEDFVVGEEELFGSDLSDLFDDDKDEPSKDTDQLSDDFMNMGLAADSNGQNAYPDDSEKHEDQDNAMNELISSLSFDGIDEAAEEMNESVPDEVEANEEQNIDMNELNDYLQEEDDLDLHIDHLLNSLDIDQPDNMGQVDLQRNSLIQDSPMMEEIPEDAEAAEAAALMDTEEDDLLALLNQIASDDPVSEDVIAINDLLSGKSVDQKQSSSSPSDVGEVFSDALKAVSSLSDLDIDEMNLLSQIPDKQTKKEKKKSKIKKNKRNNKNKDESAAVDTPKIGFFQSVFGNVEEDSEKKKVSSKALQEAVATKDAGKKKKPKKKGATKNKGNMETQDPENPEEETEGKAQPKKKVSKKEKQEKKKKAKEILQVIDEIEEDEGKINRLGAFIVFVFFGLLMILYITGAKAVNYTLSVQNATKYFNNDKYTQAYYEVNGMDIQDEDIEIFKKIETVMFVNKQLNSYNNYYAMGEYPDALDSLLKGLSRYNKYIELATFLGIDSDLDYVRGQILAELHNVFYLSEDEAVAMLEMIDYDDMKEYSLKVYDVVLKSRNNQ